MFLRTTLPVSSPPWLHLFICPWLLGNTPSASGHRTWTEGISHYVTALPPLLPQHFLPLKSNRVACPDGGERREMWPPGTSSDEHRSTGPRHIKQRLHNLDNDNLTWTIRVQDTCIRWIKHIIWSLMKIQIQLRQIQLKAPEIAEDLEGPKFTISDFVHHFYGHDVFKYWCFYRLTGVGVP